MKKRKPREFWVLLRCGQNTADSVNWYCNGKGSVYMNSGLEPITGDKIIRVREVMPRKKARKR